MDSLSSVLFLFQHKHMVIKELLKLLIGEVNAKLLEAVILLQKIKIIN